MNGTTRRTFLLGAVGVLLVSGRNMAQETCNEAGLTLDEILEAYNQAEAAAKMDKESFRLVIERRSVTTFTGKDKSGNMVTADGVAGTLLVNGKLVGDTLENAEFKVPAGEYKGRIRYISQKNFVAGPLGMIGMEGDFLLEVATESKNRYDILFHPGNKPWHSKGCILTGASRKVIDPKTNKVVGVELDEGNVLRDLRGIFYGTDGIPLTCPAKLIRITIKDIPYVLSPSVLIIE